MKGTAQLRRKTAAKAFGLWAAWAGIFALLAPGGAGAAETGSIGALLRAGIILPVAEELIFRGGMQSCLRPLGAGWAIAVQAVLFAALHGSWAAKLYALGMGLIFGWAAEQTGTLWVGLGLHLLNNWMVLAQSLAERGMG